jgi:hypothetical protein
MRLNRTIMAALLWLAMGDAPIPAASLASALRLGVPVRCQIGEACLVQKLFDLDPGPGRSDYRCGTLTTDGHDGIDLRVRTLADMRFGVAVISASPGRVLRTRDGEPDISVRDRGNLHGRDAGNSVIIDHGNGWQTQYSHLRNGSVTVRPGDQVRGGQPIGLIGMSGNAEFPHLHFTVRQNGLAIDPFIGTRGPADCKASSRQTTLWTPEAERALRYQPTMLIAAGISRSAPRDTVVDHDGADGSTGTTDPLLLWAQIIGAVPGDMQRFQIRGPDSRLIVNNDQPVGRGGLYWLGYAGHRPPPGGWPTGIYSGRYQYVRGKLVLFERDIRARIHSN